MIDFIHDRQPTGMGVSLSGSAAFFINSSLSDDWQRVESDPEFQRLGPQDQAAVKASFPRCLQYYLAIKATRFF